MVRYALSGDSPQARTVLLIHAGEAYGSAATDPKAGFLIKAFADKLRALQIPVFTCIAGNVLRENLARELPGASALDMQSEIAAVRQIFSDANIAHIAVVNGVFPLLDITLTEKIFGIHAEYRTDISYGENLPPGISPYFVSRDLLESLDIMEAKDADLEGPGIRAFVEKNINQFHAEVHYEEPDLRLMRLDFSLSSRRSFEKAAAIYDRLKNKNAPYAELQSLIAEKPDILVTFPSYIELEFSSTAEHKSYFSPLSYITQEKHLLSRENFERVKAYVATGLGDTSVCASGLGEPLEHPEAVQYLSELLDAPEIRYVFVETNGIQLEKLLPLAEHEAAGKLRVIVLLNALEKYADYSGAPTAMLEKVKTNMRALTQALAKAGKISQEIVYLQAFKVEENETEIDSLYALAEDLGASFLFQKYNRYAGLMPERRVSDMTPLERYACWHLRRDLFVRANGDIAFCKQTVDQSKNSARGNLTKDKLADIWANQRADFTANYHAKYPAHLPCVACDEYFTFNF